MPYHHHHHHQHHHDPPRDPAFGERVAQRFRDGRDEYHERHDDYEAGRRGLFGKKTSLWYEEQQRLREERRRRHEAREQMREERRKTRHREREERREMRDEHHGHHHHRHHYGDDHPDHQRAHSRDGLGDDPFKRHHGSHHHHRREHRGDRYRDAEFGFDGPAGRFNEDDAFGLGHDPGDHRHFRAEPHRHRAHGGHHEADWAKDGTRGFDEKHGHGGFDPRAHERGFDGGHGERHFDDGFEKQDPFSGRRRHIGHGHGHNHHRHPESDRDEPLFFDDLDDDYVAFSDDGDFGARGFERRRPREHRHRHQAGDKRFGDGGFDDLYPSLSPFDEFDSESDNDTIRPGRAQQAGDGRTHYDVLGVSQDVDQATLDKAAKLARVRAHPDKTLRPEMSADEQQRINADAAKIGEAADILTHPRKRAQYDMELRMGQYPRVDSW